jgi:hypothetical protein
VLPAGPLLVQVRTHARAHTHHALCSASWWCSRPGRCPANCVVGTNNTRRHSGMAAAGCEHQAAASADGTRSAHRRGAHLRECLTMARPTALIQSSFSCATHRTTPHHRQAGRQACGGRRDKESGDERAGALSGRVMCMRMRIHHASLPPPPPTHMHSHTQTHAHTPCRCLR